MKIYTRTGDEGQTALFAGGRISKGHARLHAYGTVDELNTIIGLALAASIDDELRNALERVQSELFSDLVNEPTLGVLNELVKKCDNETVFLLLGHKESSNTSLKNLINFRIHEM